MKLPQIGEKILIGINNKKYRFIPTEIIKSNLGTVLTAESPDQPTNQSVVKWHMTIDDNNNIIRNDEQK